LDDAARLAKLDGRGMLMSVATAGPQSRESALLAREADLESLLGHGQPRAVVVAGMGGSASSGDVLAAIASYGAATPVLVHRDLGLPPWVGGSDLVFAVSASGTTEETLSAVEETRRRGARLLGIGAPDSALADACGRARAPYIAVPQR